MTDGDELLRAYSVLKSIRDTLPEGHWIAERWPRQFNGALEKIEVALGIKLEEFKVPPAEIKRVIASSGPDPRGGGRIVNYRDGMWCERSEFLQRVESVLTYFTGLQSDGPSRIGFHSNG